MPDPTTQAIIPDHPIIHKRHWLLSTYILHRSRLCRSFSKVDCLCAGCRSYMLRARLTSGFVAPKVPLLALLTRLRSSRNTRIPNKVGHLIVGLQQQMPRCCCLTVWHMAAAVCVADAHSH